RGHGADRGDRGQRGGRARGVAQPRGARPDRRRSAAGAERSRRPVRHPPRRHRARGCAARRRRGGVVPARAAHAPASDADSDAPDSGGSVVVSRGLAQRAGRIAARPRRLDGPVRRSPGGLSAGRWTRHHSARVGPRGGRMAGSKTFHYLVVPDSVGSFLLPEIRYAYYDFAAGDYTAARAPPRALAVAQGAEPRAARPLPPLDRSASTTWSTAL